MSTLVVVGVSATGSSNGASSTLVSDSTTSTTSLVLPTSRYTGQVILVGTCNIPQYTSLPLYGGGIIEVPLIGCSDDRPECCPSLSPPKSTHAKSSSSSEQTSSTSTTSATASGVISMLSASPLSVCPQDFVDIDPVCCPRGYRLYGQAVVGGITPCYSMLSTSVSLPSAESASIVSAVAATASATATVSVIVNQVYALGLPCAVENSSGLSTGAKAGIGVGAGIGGLILLCLVMIIGLMIGRGRLGRARDRSAYDAALANQMSPNGGHMSSPVSMGSPYTAQSHLSNQPPNMYGYPLNQPYSPVQSHPSWTSQTPTVLPQYNPRPVEMQTEGREIHEIGDKEMETSAPKADIIPEQNVTSFNITVYEPHEEQVVREEPPR